MSISEVQIPHEFERQPLRLGSLLQTALLYGVLSVVALLILLPLLFALSLSLQGPTIAPTLLPDFSKLDWSSFSQVFREEPNLTRWIVNSFVVAVAVTLGQLITSALAAYALANINFPGKIVFFFFF